MFSRTIDFAPPPATRQWIWPNRVETRCLTTFIGDCSLMSLIMRSPLDSSYLRFCDHGWPRIPRCSPQTRRSVSERQALPVEQQWQGDKLQSLIGHLLNDADLLNLWMRERFRNC